MAAKETAKAATKKIEKAATKKIAEAKRGFSMTVGEAQAAAFKALGAAHKKEKVLTGPFVEKFESAWKREVKHAKKLAK